MLTSSVYISINRSNTYLIILILCSTFPWASFKYMFLPYRWLFTNQKDVIHKSRPVENNYLKGPLNVNEPSFPIVLGLASKQT